MFIRVCGFAVNSFFVLLTNPLTNNQIATVKLWELYEKNRRLMVVIVVYCGLLFRFYLLTGNVFAIIP